MRLPGATALIWLAFAGLLVGWFVYTQYQTPCRRTLAYAIGTLDPQFGEREDEFRSALAAAEAVWEEPTGFNLFTYDPAAPFKVNLIFDERQATANSQNQLEDEIVAGSADFDTKKAQYDAKRAEYERRSAALSAKIEQYNSQGGAPEPIYQELEAERRSLNQLANSLNALADELHLQAGDLNAKIDSFNVHVGHVFDQATYTGEAINLYAFENREDQVLALAHEFGHALGIEHVADPKAIMYYLLQEQDMTNPRLSQTDVDALQAVCSRKPSIESLLGGRR